MAIVPYDTYSTAPGSILLSEGLLDCGVVVHMVGPATGGVSVDEVVPGRLSIAKAEVLDPIGGVAVLDLEALLEAFRTVADLPLGARFGVHVHINSGGIAGGCWAEMEPVVRDCFAANGIDVFVYDDDSRLAVVEPRMARALSCLN